MTDHFPRPPRAATSREERVAELHRLANADYASTAQLRQQNPTWPFRPAGVRFAETCGNRWKFGKDECARERGHIGPHRNTQATEAWTFRWFDDEGTPQPSAAAPRCPATTASDSSACTGPVVVLVLGLGEGGVAGCEHHAARLIATAPGTYPVALPYAPEGAATRVFRASGEAGRR